MEIIVYTEVAGQAVLVYKPFNSEVVLKDLLQIPTNVSGVHIGGDNGVFIEAQGVCGYGYEHRFWLQHGVLPDATNQQLDNTANQNIDEP